MLYGLGVCVQVWFSAQDGISFAIGSSALQTIANDSFNCAASQSVLNCSNRDHLCYQRQSYFDC